MLGYARLVSMLPLKGCSSPGCQPTPRETGVPRGRIYQVYTHPPNQGLGIYPFLGLQLGGPPGPPRVLFGGHKGQFGSWSAPQSVVASFHKLQLIVVHVWPTNSVH